MKLVAYLRVSTTDQVDGLGLDLQRDAIAALGHDIVATYADEGVSGTTPDRPGLVDAFGMVRAGEAEGIAVYRLDRLARDVILQETLLRELWSLGGCLVSCSEAERAYVVPDDRSDPARTLIRQVLGAVSAYERAMIAFRMGSGRRKKIAAGGWGGGPVPFGWQRDGSGGLVENVEEQGAIASMRQMRDEGETLEVIAGLLNRWNTTNRGRPWTHSAVRRALLSNVD